MKINKILNNNVVIINEENIEKIVMGRGIGFNKKNGDHIDSDKIDKIFNLQDQDAQTKFQELIVSIPLEHIELGEEVITMIKTKLGRKVSDMIHISLVDHIHSSIIRHREGIEIKNFLLWDIKRFYHNEFELGLIALDIIEKNSGIRLQEDEAGFIAMHIVNAGLGGNEVDDVYRITKIMQEITHIVKYEFKVEFATESAYYYRFITHLKFFAQRLIQGTSYNSQEDELLMIVADKYRNSYQCVLKISDYIYKKYNYLISNDEKVYLTIHIERVVYKER